MKKIKLSLLLTLSMSLFMVPTFTAASVEIWIEGSWTAADFTVTEPWDPLYDLNDPEFDGKVFGESPSAGATTVKLRVNTASPLFFPAGYTYTYLGVNYTLMHDFYGYTEVTLASDPYIFGTATWNNSGILTGLVGPDEELASLWTDANIITKTPSRLSFRMFGSGDGLTSDLFVGSRTPSSIGSQFLLWEYYDGEEIRSNNYSVIRKSRPGIFIQPFNTQFDGFFSNISGQVGADQFSFSVPSTITGLRWYGFYGDDLPAGTSEIDFTIKFFNDNGGIPGSELMGEVVTAQLSDTGSKVTTHLYTGGTTDAIVYEFRCNLNSSLPVAADEILWLMVAESDFDTVAAGDTQWQWIFSSFKATDTKAYAHGSDLTDWTLSNQYGNLAFELHGNQVPTSFLAYTPITPCRIVDTRNTSAGIIGVSTQRNFRVFGSGGTISAQGGNPGGCPSPGGEPLAAHINMVAVNPTGKGNLQAFPVGTGAGAGLSVNYNTIDTNLANAGTVRAISGTGPDITVASNFSSAHTVVDVLGYYYPEGDLLYTPVTPCRIVDTRNTSAGIIGVSTLRDFYVHGSGSIIGPQGGNFYGCPSPMGVPLAAHINMVAVNPTGKGNLQAFPVGAGAGAGLSVNYNTIDTNLANAGTVRAISGTGPDITVASNFSSTHTVVDVLGYYYPEGDLLYTPVTPCRIADTRKTSAGIIGASGQRNFRVFGSGGTISAQGGNPAGCSSPSGEPLAAHINMVAVNPTGKGNLQAFPVGAGAGAGLSVNYNTIDTNLANAGTVKTVTGGGADITVTSNFSSAHTVIDVLGYYYSAP